MDSVTAFPVVASLMLMVALAGSDPYLQPPEIIVKEGDTTRFACTPLIPAALPVLEKNDFLITSSNPEPRLEYQDYGLGTGNGNRTYALSDVTLKDDGTRFRCIIAGVVSNTAILNVVVPPTVSATFSYLTIIEGDNKTLNFTVTGDPPPHSYTWLRNGQLLIDDERVSTANNVLRIRKASRLDSGNYTLRVASSVGEDTAWTVLEVAYNEFLHVPHDATIFDGETLTLDCLHQFGQSYTWRANDTVLNSQDDKADIVRDGLQLRYGPVDYRDNSLLIYCVAHLNNGRQFVSPPGRLEVIAPPHVQPPPEPITITEGTTVTLHFIVTSHPPATSFTFQYNDRQLEVSGPGISILGGTSLVVMATPRTAAGKYTLVAGNSQGEGSGSVQLIVYHPPSITPLSEPVVAQIHRDVSIPCGAGIESTPQPTYSWTCCNGLVVTESQELAGRITLQEDGNLLLRSAEYSDGGTFKCTASNFLGSSSTSVQLLVLDPPTEPRNPQLLQIGPTWVRLRWTPPTNNGSLPLSNYQAVAAPQLLADNNGGSTPTQNALGFFATELNLSVPISSEQTFSNNSTCVEVVCEPSHVLVSAGTTEANVSSLIPSTPYQVVVMALSNGTNLESVPSTPVSFATEVYVPGIGAVVAMVMGPAAITVQWALAYSGGLPVLYFDLSFRRINTSEWRAPMGSEAVTTGMGMGPPPISGHTRSLTVHGLESEELYEFRVLAANELGKGMFVKSEPILSHPIGVPSQPSKPAIIGWGEDFAIIATSIQKLGSSMNFSVTLILQVGGTEVQSHVELLENYESGTQVQLLFPNVSYCGAWQVQVFASNHLGDSEYSVLSLTTDLSVISVPFPYHVAAPTIGALVGVINCIIVVGVAVICVVTVRDSFMQRRRLAKTLDAHKHLSQLKDAGIELAQAANDSTDGPLSPRSILYSGEYRYSPSNGNAHGAPNEPVYDQPRRRGLSTSYTLPAAVSSASAV